MTAMFRVISSVLFLITCSTNVLAQDIKLGFVDTARVLKEAPQAERARQKLEAEFAPRDEKIVEMQKQLKELDEKQTRDMTVMSDSARRDLERDIIGLRRDIKRAREEFTEDFNLRRNDELTRLQKIIYETTVSVAKEQGYDVILSDSVLYTSKRIDITGIVLERLRLASGSSAPKQGAK